MSDQAVVPPDLSSDLLPRLETFIVPFAETLVGAERKRHTAEYISGLLSNLEPRPVKGSPTSMTSNGRASRNSSGTSRGIISPCSGPWPARSATSWVNPTA